MTNLVLYRVHAWKNFGTVKRWSEYDSEWYYDNDTREEDHLFHGSEIAWQKYRQLCRELKDTNAEISILRKIVPIDGECEIKMDLQSWIVIERSEMEPD